MRSSCIFSTISAAFRRLRPWLLPLAAACLGCDSYPSTPVVGPSSPKAERTGQSSKLTLVEGERPFQYMGSQSCASTACHGNVAITVNVDTALQPAIAGTEFIVWQSDPHRHAADTLGNGASQNILARLGVQKAGMDDASDPRVRNCLACHDPGTAAPRSSQDVAPRQDATRILRSNRGDGVGCESCHGPAEHWQMQHFHPNFLALTNQEKFEQFGMRDLSNLLSRGRICAKCHVGEEGRDVNHDLIAAGHPELKFELSSYHELVPKHWSDHRQRKDVKNFELRLWLAGQITVAEASLQQLRARAQQSQKIDGTLSTPWPEFAAYDCYSCHHDLVHDSVRQIQDYKISKIGGLVWDRWHTSIPAALGRISRSSNQHRLWPPSKLHTAIERIRDAMESDIVADAKKIERLTDDAITQLAAWIDRDDVGDYLLAREPRLAQTNSDWAKETPGAMFVLLNSIVSEAAPSNWDTATQWYLAAAALDRSLKDDTAGSDGNRMFSIRYLVELRNTLTFPPGFNSPRHFETLDHPLSQKQLHITLQNLQSFWERRSSGVLPNIRESGKRPRDNPD